MIKAEIITIGDEILIGQIVDTNSAWMGKKLNEIGISVHQISSISDNKTHIQQALKDAFKRVDIVLMTGGLGPTKDDITKQSLADYFNTRLITFKAEPGRDYREAVQSALRFEILMLEHDSSLKFISRDEEKFRIKELKKRLK